MLRKQGPGDRKSLIGRFPLNLAGRLRVWVALPSCHPLRLGCVAWRSSDRPVDRCRPSSALRAGTAVLGCVLAGQRPRTAALIIAPWRPVVPRGGPSGYTSPHIWTTHNERAACSGASRARLSSCDAARGQPTASGALTSQGLGTGFLLSEILYGLSIFMYNIAISRKEAGHTTCCRPGSGESERET